MHPYPKYFNLMCTHPDPTDPTPFFDFRAKSGLRLLVGLGPGTRYMVILLMVVVYFIGLHGLR